MSGYCQASDRQMAPPGGATQPRPRRPRPPVWCSASTTAARAGAPAAAPLATACWWTRASIRPAAPRCARARRRGSSACDALRRQRADARREPIALVGLRVERDAELAQLLHRLPHRGARHRQIRGQRFARLEGAVVEPLEHALRQRPGRWRGFTCGRARTATACARAARCRRACAARCRDACRCTSTAQASANPSSGVQHARRHAAVDRRGWRARR